MSDKEKFISEKMKILVGKEGYSRPQAYSISLSYWNRENEKLQQGGKFNSDLKPIYSIQQGVSNDKMGNGVFINYKDPTEHGFSPSRDREFVTNEAYKNTVIRTPSYQKYSYDKSNNTPFQDNSVIDDNYKPTQPSSHLKPIYSIQEGVTNDKLGKGKYILYKSQSDPSFNYKNDRDFITNQAFEQQVLRSSAYQKYSRDLAQRNKIDFNTPLPELAQASLQQGGQNMLFKKTSIPMEDYNYQPTNNNYYNNNPSVLNNYSLPEQSTTSNYVTPENNYYNTNPSVLNNYNLDPSTTPAETAKTENSNTKYYDTNRVNIANPYGDMSLDYTIGRTGQAFGEGDYLTGAAGAGLSLIKGARNFLTGFSTAKENKRISQEYNDKRYEDNRRFIAGQQGGKIKNSDVIAQNAITDNPQGSINLESNEFVMRTNGQIQPVVGDKHIENGKIGKGVNAQLNDGDKVLSNYVKLMPNDIKDLKERYNISLNRGVTFAEAQKKIDQKLGIKKLEGEKADFLEKIEKANNIKDDNTKQLSIQALTKKIGGVNEKINTLSDVRASNFEYLFQKQEQQPKKGNPGELFDENGKKVTESNNTIAQQGGYIESLADKHGISVDRAMELIKMQQGGVQSQQEEVQEGQASNTQEERGEISPEQIIQAYAQISQQDPQQIIAQLQKMQPEEQQKALEQMMQALQQGQQNPKEEQVEGQISNPQEEQMEVAQQGLTYEQIVARNNSVGTNLNTPSVWTGQTANEFYNPYSNWETYLGRTPRDINSHEIYQKGVSSDLNPQISQLITSGEMPLTNKHRELLKKAGIQGADKITNYTSLSEKDRAKLGQDFILNGYTDTLAGHRGISIQPGEMTQEDYAKASGKYDKMTDVDGRQIYAKYDKGKLLKDDKGNFVFYYPKKAGEPEKKVEESKIADGTKVTLAEQPNEKVVARDKVQTILPNFSNYIPLFSPMQSIAKENISIPRLEPIKATPEPMLAEQERQRQADVDRVEQTGMSPQQQEAILAQGLASSQMASNDAISKVENYNAQNQFATDQYNVNAQTKEDIMNSQYRQDYQNKVMQTIANNEESMRNQYRTNFLQDQANSNRVIDMNRANALNDQFAITPDGIVALNNKPYDIKYNGLLPKDYDKMTPSQRIAAMKKLIEDEKLKSNTSK